MTMLGNFLIAVAGFLDVVLTMFFWVIIARCILSFVSPDPRNQLVQIIYNISEPSMAWFRKYIPPVGMFDLSALVLLLVIGFAQQFLVGSLNDYGAQLRAAGNVVGVV